MTDLPVLETACAPWSALLDQAAGAEAAGQLRRAEVKLLEALGIAFEHPGVEPAALVHCALHLARFHGRHGPPEAADRFARQAAAFAEGAGLPDLAAEARALLRPADDSPPR